MDGKMSTDIRKTNTKTLKGKQLYNYMDCFSVAATVQIFSPQTFRFVLYCRKRHKGGVRNE